MLGRGAARVTPRATGQAYVLMTPARDEEAHIERTLQSVINQDVLPERWVIVDDGSTDRTAEIVRRYAGDHPFIELIESAHRPERSFASKATVVADAYAELATSPFHFVGNLDADVSFPPDYFASVLAHFDADPDLGLAGGIQVDWVDDDWQLVRQSSNSVAGPFQFFRRRCYEEVGGYPRLPYGGIDAAAEFGARMRGWEVRALPELTVFHHRQTGSAKYGPLKARYRAGQRDATIGYHPAFAAVRAGQLAVGGGLAGPVGSLCFLAGYLAATVTRPAPRLDEDVRRFVRAEQVDRLRALVRTRRDPVARVTTLDRPLVAAPYGEG